MPSSGMWSRVVLTWSDVSEECIASIFRISTCSRWFLARGLFCPGDGGDTSLRNVGSRKNYTSHIPQNGILDSIIFVLLIPSEPLNRIAAKVEGRWSVYTLSFLVLSSALKPTPVLARNSVNTVKFCFLSTYTPMEIKIMQWKIGLICSNNFKLI
jgi:hypothetical protein